MERKWENFVDIDSLIEDILIVVAVRISDNVLDEENWPIHTLKFNEKGVCVKQVVENEGVYKMKDFVGKNFYDLWDWSNYDTNGSEGEMTHDLCRLIYF